MPKKKLTAGQMKSRMFLMWAQHIRKTTKPTRLRERAIWGLLLEWASCGGKPEEEIHD
jgi:hypothetical protein